jgi:hypothetical protein
MRLRSERQTGRCWCCKRVMVLRDDGRVRRHRVAPGVYCKGSVTMPLLRLQA